MSHLPKKPNWKSLLWALPMVSMGVFLPIVFGETLSPHGDLTPTTKASPSPLPKSDLEASTAYQKWRFALVRESLTWRLPVKVATHSTKEKSAVANRKNKSGKSRKIKDDHPDVPVVQIRVAVVRDASALAIATSTSGEVVSLKGKVLTRLAANQGVSVLPSGASLRFGSSDLPYAVWIRAKQGGFVYVGDNWYRGTVMLVSQGNTLLAVNYVDMENYLASVVGAEVSPSWPEAALKAQAIAARSYALVHYFRPANRLYDLGNTQRWQVYKGIVAEYNTTHQAVQDTGGMFLSYKGGVVESLYAASDEIVQNVFEGRGMSQTGAYEMAKSGYNYQQILGRYYPGTSLAQIVINEDHQE